MDMADALRASGLRATPQRLAVLRAVTTSRRHPCADEVYRQVGRSLPSISLGTVYKALGELRDAGLLRDLPVAGKLRFDSNPEPHHHLVCERCRKVVDVPLGEASGDPRLQPEAAGGFEILGADVTFRGICPGCRERSGVAASSKEIEKRRAS